jgi:hypothetical protein
LEGEESPSKAACKALLDKTLTPAQQQEVKIISIIWGQPLSSLPRKCCLQLSSTLGFLETENSENEQSRLFSRLIFTCQANSMTCKNKTQAYIGSTSRFLRF